MKGKHHKMELIYLKKTNKSIYGILKKHCQKIFFKFKKENFDLELNGYFMIKKFYQVPKLLAFDRERKILLYEYKKIIHKKLLHKILYTQKKIHPNKVLKIYQKPFKNYQLLQEKDCVNQLFFANRLPKLDDYLLSNNPLFLKNLVINGGDLHCSFADMLRIIKINIAKEKQTIAVMTQGDPTDINLTYSRYITDFECAGMNSLLGEMAVFLNNIMINGFYFFLKYPTSTYTELTHTLSQTKNNIKLLNAIETPTTLAIHFEYHIPNNNQKLLLAYIELIKKTIPAEKLKQMESDLKYYLAFRLITPKNITEFTKEDLLLSIGLIGIIIHKISDLESLIQFIKEYK